MKFANQLIQITTLFIRLPIYLLCFFILSPFTIVLAQDAENSISLSVDEAIQYAHQNHGTVLNASLDEKIATKKIHEITGQGLPQITASFDLKDFIELPTQLVPGEFFGGEPGTFTPVQFGTQYNATAGIEASQLLFNSSYLLGLKAAKSFQELSIKNIERTKVETSVNVSKAYYMVLINENRLELLEANIVRIEGLLRDTKVLEKNGFVEKIDLNRLEVKYNGLVTEREKVKKLMVLSMNLLKFQMGMSIETNLTLTDSIESWDTSTTSPVDQFMYEDRIEFSLLESQRELLNIDLKRNNLAYLPSLVAYGNFSYQAQRNEFDIFDFSAGNKWFKTSLIGVTLGIPIFDGLQKSAIIQQSKLELLKVDNNEEMLKQSIDLELSNALTNLTNAKSSLESQRRNMELAESIVEVARKKYEKGVGSNLEILNSETDLKQAQTDYLNALFDLIMANIDFKKAMGLY
jgi:outer membrane protein